MHMTYLLWSYLVTTKLFLSDKFVTNMLKFINFNQFCYNNIQITKDRPIRREKLREKIITLKLYVDYF